MEVLITKTIVELCQFLRRNGFPAGIQETLDALQAVHVVNVMDRESVKLALSALFCSSREDVELFDRLFETFWNIHQESGSGPNTRSSAKPISIQGKFTRSTSAETGTSEIEEKETVGASATERLKKIDFSKVSASDLPLLEEIAFRLWKRMSVRLTRRSRAGGEQDRLDLRRTIRAGIGHGGDPIDLRYRGPKRKKLRLITLLDVSGSMDLYSMFLLRFLYALHQYFKRVDSFLFGTRLTYIGSALQAQNWRAVTTNLSQQVEDWSGGTRIGECLKDFNQRYGKILSRRSLVIILSDGWDTGEPEILVEQLRLIKRRAGKLIWLNPLLGLPDYQPVTRGMAAALPLTDVFAPAHNLHSLLELEHHL